MSKTKATPILASMDAIFSTPDGFNDATLRDAQRQVFAPAEMPYTAITDQGLASRRSKTVVRDHAAVAAATTGVPSLAEGLSLREAMAGQCENDQFPFSADRFGKQRN
jgi:hypothetical protein